MSTDAAMILVVDDNERNRVLLSSQLEALGYDVQTAVNGVEALKRIAVEPPDLMLLDIMMPELDGHEVLERMTSDETIRSVPVVVVSAVDELDSLVRSLERGADDYLVKPVEAGLLRARVENCLEKKRLRDGEKALRTMLEEYNSVLEDRVRSEIDRTSKAHLGTIFAMSKLAESRDPETGEHLERMRAYCRILAEELAVSSPYESLIDSSFVDDIYSASPLHDIGKVGIPDRILLKPGRLTDEEFHVIKQHPLVGAETLRAVCNECPDNSFLTMGLEVAEFHHEKWNGSGYPHGRSGEAIPLSARIVALGDAYDALTSKRCYKDAFSHEKSRDVISGDSGTHFDPVIVDAFLKREAEFIRLRESIQDSEKHVLV